MEWIANSKKIVAYLKTGQFAYLEYSQIWLNHPPGWSPLQLPHKIAKLK